MRKILGLLPLCFLAACGGGNDASKLAKDVCDCYQKVNSLAADDPRRIQAGADCMKLQGEAWNKVKDDQKKMDAFNKAIGECGSAMMRESLGK